MTSFRRQRNDIDGSAMSLRCFIPAGDPAVELLAVLRRSRRWVCTVCIIPRNGYPVYKGLIFISISGIFQAQAEKTDGPKDTAQFTRKEVTSLSYFVAQGKAN